MKKLLQINSVINSGSTGRIAEEIGELSINKGWESYIAFGRNNKESKSKKINLNDKFGVLWHVFLTRLFDLHGFGSKRATNKLIEEIKKIKPDIVHLHNIHGYYLNVKILSEYLSKIDTPVVWTLHDCWPIMGHGAYFKEIKSKGKEEFLNAPKSEYPKNWFFSNGYRNYKRKKEVFLRIKSLTLVPVSDWLLEIIQNSFFKKNVCIRIHNGIDLQVFHPSNSKELKNKLEVENKSIFLGVASIWEERKGLTDFIELSKFLKEDEVIVLVGVTNEIISNLPNNIIGVRRTESTEELAKLYSISSVFLNLTYEDNFPTTNLESLACGTPVITYKTGGSPEAVSEGTGIVVNQGDLIGVRNGIDKILSSALDYSVEKCRERAEKYYNKKDRFNEYIELYDKLLKNKNVKK